MAGARIIEAAREALAWVRGGTTSRVRLPDGSTREVTAAELRELGRKQGKRRAF